MRFTRLFTQRLRQQVYDSGCIPADREYLAALRALTERHGSVPIFDEVLSTFRTGPSCAQGYCGIVPDLCAIAKGIANGAPIALVAGRRDLMGLLAPLGPVAHSGTYTDHLFGILAGLACLDELTKPNTYPPMLAVADRLYRGLSDAFVRHGIPGRVQGLGIRFVRDCVEHGVYFQSIGHAIGHHGISAAHTAADIEWVLERMDNVIRGLASGRR